LILFDGNEPFGFSTIVLEVKGFAGVLDTNLKEKEE
jgi:hypothetical protein